MKINLVGVMAVAITLFFMPACMGPTGNSAAKPEDSSLTSGDTDSNSEAPAPTIGTLTGTWVAKQILPSVTTVSDSTETTTYGAGGSYFQSTVLVTTDLDGNFPQTNYSQNKGTFTLAGDELSTSISEARNSSGQDFANDDIGWSPRSPVRVTISKPILYGGKLYFGVATAVGETSGVVGTWVTSSYQSWFPTLYAKTVATYTSDNTWEMKTFSSTSSTFSAEPNQIRSGNYTVSGNQITRKQVEPAPATERVGTIYMSVMGPYLVSGPDDTLGAFTKQ